MSNISRYFKIHRSERHLLRVALWNLYLSKIQLSFKSFKKIAETRKSTGESTLSSKEELIQIRKAIRRANKLTFWKNKCLASTLTARKMLNKRGHASIASLGVRKDEKDQLIAHSWIISNEIEIVPKGDDFKELHQF